MIEEATWYYEEEDALSEGESTGEAEIELPLDWWSTRMNRSEQGWGIRMRSLFCSVPEDEIEPRWMVQRSSRIKSETGRRVDNDSDQ